MTHRISLALGLLAALAGGSVYSVERAASAMAGAAATFLAALTPEQRQQAAFPFAGDERLRWHFIPTESFPRKGLPLRDMTGPQRALAHDLLKSGLSQRGYLAASSIIDLETVLADLERAERAERAATPGRPAGTGLERDPSKYFFSVFGTPSARDTWGWRVEGHHISLHFTVVNGTLVAAAPAFFGSNPAEVRQGPKEGLRILGAQEDAARELLLSLDAAQRSLATLAATAPNDIVTMASVDISPLAPAGLAAAALNPSQRALLMKLVEVYTGYMAADIAEERLAKLRRAGIEKIAFAWAGEAERGKKHYYRIQGPTFLVEYDNTQNDGNHIHSVWRDFDGDFGRDLLREHVKGTPH